MNNLTSGQKKIFIIIAIIAVSIIGYYVYGRDDNYTQITQDEEMLIAENDTKEEIEKEDKIVVHIIGEVVNAGIVELEENSRISDAIDAAGGLTENADMTKINLAYVLEDGMKITIPSKSENLDENIIEDNLVSTDSGIVVETQGNNVAESGKVELININNATQTELETLPGIGASTAMKIINYRNENGKFYSIEDLKNVSGIGDAKFENIKNLICIK